MTRIFTACLLAGVTIGFSAAQASADPEDLVPFCTGGQTPADNNCRPAAPQETTHGSGLTPNVPNGLDPSNPAVVG